MIIYSISKTNPNIVEPTVTIYCHRERSLWHLRKKSIKLHHRASADHQDRCVANVSAFFCIDLNSADLLSPQSVALWNPLYLPPQNASVGVSRMLLGNKCDIEAKRKVSRETGEKVRCSFCQALTVRNDRGRVETAWKTGSGTLGKDWVCHFFLDAPMFTLDEKQEMIIGHILAACNEAYFVDSWLKITVSSSSRRVQSPALMWRRWAGHLTC